MPVADEETWAQELRPSSHGSDVVLTLAAELHLWTRVGLCCLAMARQPLCCSVSRMCPPWPPPPGPTLGFSLGVILLLWPSLVDLTGYFICFSHLDPDCACFGAQVKLFRNLSRLEIWNLSFFSPASSLSMCFGTEGTLVPDYTHLVGIHSLRQPGSGSSFLPYLDLDLHSSVQRKTVHDGWKNQGQYLRFFFLTFPTLSVFTAVRFFLTRITLQV